MTDDIENVPDEVAPKKSSGRIFIQELEEGLDALEMKTHRLLISAFSAGMEISFSLLLIALTMAAAGETEDSPLLNVLLASMYSFGFIIVILGRSELFTEQTTLAILPLLAGKTTLAKVARLWGVVYVGNMIGAAVGSMLIVLIAPATGKVPYGVFSEIATGVAHHPVRVMLLSAVLAGWLMGLLSWLVAAGRDTISQIVLIWLLTAAIGLGHLHHAILGTTEVLAGYYTGAPITLGGVGRFLLWTTLGNAMGGAISSAC